MRRGITILALAIALAASGCGEQKTSDTSAEVADGKTDSAPPTSPVAFCDELQRMVSADDCTLARDLVARATAGIGAFNAPSPMARGKPVELQLVLAFAPPPPAPAPAAEPTPTGSPPVAMAPAPGPVDRAEPPPPVPAPRPTPAATVDPLPGPTVAFTPVVGRHMAAELTGDGFDIVAKSPRSQDVLPDSQTSWEWSVTARRRGPLTLTLKTIVEAEFAGGKRYALRSLTTNRTIDVSVSPLDQAADMLDALPGWLKRIAAVLTAAGVLVAAWLGFRAAFKPKPTP